MQQVVLALNAMVDILDENSVLSDEDERSWLLWQLSIQSEVVFEVRPAPLFPVFNV